MTRPLFALALACSSVTALAQSTTATEQRVSALTAYAAPDADAVRMERGRDVAPFLSRASQLRWYGAFAHAGEVHARIAVAVPSGDTVTLQLDVAAEPRGAVQDAASRAGEHWTIGDRVTRRVVGGDSTMLVDFDSVHVAAPGFVRFALRADGRRTARVTVQALLLGGAPAADAHFHSEPRRNAASVHLRYPVDSASEITGFYNEVVAVEDPVDTYYMATGFARGYFGMQVNSPTERRIIFSVWDAGAGTNANDRRTVAADDQVQLLAKGDGVVAEVFGNEGTGGHSHSVTAWRTGEVQRFYVTAENSRERQTTAENGSRAASTIYTGYWYDNDRMAWRLIARFRAPRDSLGLRRLYSFSEDFGGSRGDVVRKARFGPAWVRLATGEWRELTTATFSHDPTGRTQRLDRFMGVEDGRFFLQHGGFVTGFTAMGTAFTRPATGTPPSIDLPALVRAP